MSLGRWSATGAPIVAERIAGLIDGLYLHAVQDPDSQSGEEAVRQVVAALDNELRSA